MSIGENASLFKLNPEPHKETQADTWSPCDQLNVLYFQVYSFPAKRGMLPLEPALNNEATYSRCCHELDKGHPFVTC